MSDEHNTDETDMLVAISWYATCLDEWHYADGWEAERWRIRCVDAYRRCREVGWPSQVINPMARVAGFTVKGGRIQ